MADGFLSRWSRLKTQARETTLRDHPTAAELAATAAPATAGLAERTPAASVAGERALPNLPTIEDALQLGPDSDYSAFVARGVDASVRRQALRKLFTDPHFNVIDGLDVYMGDYTKSDPIAPAMLASLQHAGAWLRTQLEDDDPAPAQQGRPQDHQDMQQHDQQHDQQHHHRQDDLPDQQEATAPQRAPAREHDEH